MSLRNASLLPAVILILRELLRTGTIYLIRFSTTLTAEILKHRWILSNHPKLLTNIWNYFNDLVLVWNFGFFLFNISLLMFIVEFQVLFSVMWITISSCWLFSCICISEFFYLYLYICVFFHMCAIRVLAPVLNKSIPDTSTIQDT